MTYSIASVPKDEKTSITCDVCGEQILHPKTDCPEELRGAFCSRALLQCDDVLCWWCYLQWYEEGMTNREEIKHLSRLARYRWSQEDKT